MVKIFKSPSGPDPIAGKMRELGQALFGNQVGSALENEKLYNAQRINIETDNLMRRIAEGGGVQALGSDPISQAILIGAGYDPGDFSKIGRMGAATEFGARDPRTVNWQIGAGDPYSSTAPAFDATLAEKRRENDMQSADRRYGVDQDRLQKIFEFGNLSADQAADNAEATRNNDMQSADRRYGVDQNIGQQRYEFDRKPVAVLGPDGQPIYAPQVEAPGARPVLSETDQKGTLLGQNWDNLPALNPMQRQVLGANPSEKTQTPRNYVLGNKSFITYDGVTDAQSGQPLPPGGYIGNVEGGAGDVGLTNSTQSGLQQGILANNKLSNLLAETRRYAEQDPTNFGIPGFIKGVAQDVSQIAQGLAVGFGYQGAEQMLQDAQQRAMRSGVDPNLISGVFDPNLSSLQTLSDLMVYSAAEALAGQSGRSVSDKDVQFFKGIVGDPRDWMMTQQKFLAKLTQIERLLRMNQKEYGAAQSQGAVPRFAAPEAGTPAPVAPAAPQGGVNVDDLVNKYRSR